MEVAEQHPPAAVIGSTVSDERLRRSKDGRVHVIPCTGEGDLVVETTGNGPPLVLIHGWGVDRRMWAHQLAAFRRRFRTVTYDRRGFGQSTCAAGLDQELDDLDNILAYLKLARVALLGMSQGGRIAMRFASSRSERISALVLQGAPLDGLSPPPGDQCVIPVTELAQLLKIGDRNALIDRISRHSLFNPGPRFSQARDEILTMLREYRGEDLPLQPPASADIDESVNQLGRIAVPTMVITGSREALWLRGVADFTARNIRGARRRVIRGGGHFVNMTHATAYNSCVLDFLTRSTTPWSERASDSA